jgi:hypothetical protein
MRASSKKIQLLSPNPNQLVGFSRKANSKECAHDERCDSQSDDSCNFHDFVIDSRIWETGSVLSQSPSCLSRLLPEPS